MRAIMISILVFLLLFTFTYAENLDVRVAQDTEFGKSYSTIKRSPGEELIFFIEVKNENDDRRDNDQDIEDIIVSLTIENINDGSDIEREYDDFELKARGDEKLTFETTIPNRIEEGNYKIIVDYEYEEANVEYSESDDYSLIIEKDKHDVEVKVLSFENDKINCNEVATINLEILNSGSSDEKTSFVLENQELNFNIKREFNLEAYPGTDIFKQEYRVKTPEHTVGNYPISLDLSYGALKVKKTINLGISCNGVAMPEEMTKEIAEPMGEQIKEETIVTIPKTQENRPETIVVTKDDNNLFVPVILGLLVLVAVITLIFIKKR